MPNVEFEYPKILAFEHPADTAHNTALPLELTQRILEQTLSGVVTKDGEWGVDKDGFIHQPPGFTIQHITIGHYQVTHGLGYNGLTLSVSLFQSPGSFTILENNPTYFVIVTNVNGVDTDMPFMFSVSKTLPR